MRCGAATCAAATPVVSACDVRGHSSTGGDHSPPKRLVYRPSAVDCRVPHHPQAPLWNPASSIITSDATTCEEKLHSGAVVGGVRLGTDRRRMHLRHLPGSPSCGTRNGRESSAHGRVPPTQAVLKTAGFAAFLSARWEATTIFGSN